MKPDPDLYQISVFIRHHEFALQEIAQKMSHRFGSKPYRWVYFINRFLSGERQPTPEKRAALLQAFQEVAGPILNRGKE